MGYLAIKHFDKSHLIVTLCSIFPNLYHWRWKTGSRLGLSLDAFSKKEMGKWFRFFVVVVFVFKSSALLSI